MTPVMGLLSLALALLSSALIPAGNPAPTLEGQTLNGSAWTDALTGQVTIVEFFATWCPHCRRSLAAQHKLAGTRQVRLIIVDVDEDPELVQAFFSRNPPPRNAGVLVDRSGRARQNWGVTGFPATYLVDEKGVIRGSFSGWGDRSAAWLARQIDELQGAALRTDDTKPATARRRARERDQGKDRPPPARGVSPDEHARQLGVEVLR